MRYKLALILILSVSLAACGSSAASYNNEGNRSFNESAYDEALQNYDQAKQEDPALAEPYYNSGNTFHRQGDLEAASDQLRQSVHADDEALAQKSLFNLGNTYFKGQSWSEAAEAYIQALLIDPNDVDAKTNLELALQQQQQQQQQQQEQQQQQQNQGGGNQQQQPQGQPQEPQEDEGESGGEGQDEQQDQGQNQEQQEQPQSSRGELSPEEAKQLLDALGQDSQTLQERLQQQLGPPAIPPAQDW